MSTASILTEKGIAKRTRQIIGQYPKGMRLPKYRRHAQSGRAVIQYRPLFGPNPRYLLGPYGSDESLADYAKCLAKVVKHKLLLASPPSKVARVQSELTVNAALLDFINWATEHYGPGRELSHIKRAIRPLKKRYGGCLLRTIGPVRMKKVRSDMVELGWCRKHVNAQFDRLRRAFAWFVENELMKARQLAAIRAVKGLRRGRTNAPEHEPVAPVAWEEAKQVLPHVAPVVATMIEVQYLTGMRSAELTGMTIEQIEFRADVWLYRPKRHKTDYRNKPKVIALGPRAQALIIPYLQVPNDQYLFSPRIAMREHHQARRKRARAKLYGHRKNSRFNPNRYRDRYTTDGYSHALAHGFDLMDKDRPEDDKVHRWHQHQLRHARATLTRERYDLEGSQSQLGNTLQATEIYAQKSLPLAITIAVETG